MTVDVTCPQCGAEWGLEGDEAQQPDFTCSECGFSFSVQDALSAEVKEPYPALRFIAALNRICGVIILAGGFIFAFTIGRDSPALLIAAIALSIIGCIFQFAVAESTMLFIDIANNTKRTNQLLERVVHKQKQ